MLGLSEDCIVAVFKRRKPMSTQHKDINKEQEASGSIFTEDTMQHIQAPPPESFPKPPQRPPRTNRTYWFAAAAAIVVVALIFSVFALVFSLQGQRPSNQATPTATTKATSTTTPGSTVTPTPGTVDTTPTPAPGVVPGPQPGPATVSDPAYWDRILGTAGTNGKVESVSFANILGNPTLQAVVTVRHSDAKSTLDVYVFDKITSAKPTQLFKMQGLVKGDAKISYYNTVMTAEVDLNSPVNAGKSSGQWTRDIFREFAWDRGEGTLVQIAFPGIFPDLTRYQAEADQAQVNQGHQPWKLSATMTAQAFGANLLHWDPNAPATLVSGGGAKDTQAVVSLKDTSPGGSAITLTMARLEGNANGGIWIVTSVETAGLSITQPQSADIIHSSTTVTGTGSAFEGVIGKVTILDHLYTNIGQATVHGKTGNGSTTFSTTVTSKPTFKAGIEEGLVLPTSENNAAGGVAGAVIVKVLIQQ